MQIALNLRSALIALLLVFVPLVDGARAVDDQPRVRIIATDFVLKGKLDRIANIAQRQGVTLDHVYVDAPGDPKAWIASVDLVILDTPRPGDAAKVQERVGADLAASDRPWLRVGGGQPAFANMSPPQARRLSGYYAGGGEANLTAMFAYLAASKAGTDTSTIAAPVPLASRGFYHPSAPHPFADIDAYLAWGAQRWNPGAPRVAFIIHPGLLAGFETAAVDMMITRAEAAGLLPVAFWFEARDPEALQQVLGPGKADVIVIATHLQNGSARSAEFRKLDVPVLQAISSRAGSPEQWAAAQSGIAQQLVAPFLAVPESLGVSDAIVTDALEDGRPTPMPEQVEALIAKARRLAVLRHKAAAEKKLALMFWNYPPGDKNFSASNLNVPRSVQRLTSALAEAGYAVPQLGENQLIEIGQALLGGIYHPETLPELHKRGYAATFPVRTYRAWLDRLPAARRDELIARWGQPEVAQTVFEIDGERQFVVPRYEVGHLALMPQPQRGGGGGSNYHDTKEPPSHAYLAAYLLLADRGADALIHFGTHGTQEWMPGKDRGLAVTDYPFLAVGDLPVLYPYIQDNIAEAVQAKRRGRAVIVSHQTPPFAPAGLYDELRDLHAKIHEYIQLDDGSVRDQTAAEIRAIAIKSNINRDMSWDEGRMAGDFLGFLAALHDHIHELGRQSMPLGLHTFGEPATSDNRIATVMQQLGEPFYRQVGSQPDELFAADFSSFQATAPYRILRDVFASGGTVPSDAAPELKATLERAIVLDRRLTDTQEMEALLAGLAGRFVQPGAGGDPIRNPDVPSGRNIYPFESDKVPTRAAYDAGGAALSQLLDAYRTEHADAMPQKLAFSLWGSETMRHLGIQESQILHALGLRPVWDGGGRLVRLDIIPRAELGRARIDTVIQVTSVYRDQFDSFMRMLADAIERVAALDEPDNSVASNARALEARLIGRNQDAATARRLASLRMFSNAVGDYGTSLPGSVLKSASWDNEASLADAYLDRLQYAYGSGDWGVSIGGTNLFSEQLKGVQAAVLSRSSKLHGLLSTDHPFEYLGGLSLAIRHLSGASPSLYVTDLREQTSRVGSVARFLADEMRSRYLNPHWIAGMQKEGYAGTLEILNAVNNLWGWQVTDPTSVRADQWQAVHDTFVLDKHELGLAAWFKQSNPAAEAQMIERMVEAVRKGYWKASEQTKRELVERLREIEDGPNSQMTAAATRAFIAKLRAGFDLSAIAQPASEPAPAPAPVSEAGGESVQGVVMQQVQASPGGHRPKWQLWAGLASLLVCFVIGVFMQGRSDVRLREERLST